MSNPISFPLDLLQPEDPCPVPRPPRRPALARVHVLRGGGGIVRARVGVRGQDGGDALQQVQRQRQGDHENGGEVSKEGEVTAYDFLLVKMHGMMSCGLFVQFGYQRISVWLPMDGRITVTIDHLLQIDILW